MKSIALAIAGSLLLAAFSWADTATLKMRFVFDGQPPPKRQINVPPALAPAGGPIIDETLLVDPKSKGIRNVIVYVYTGRGGSQLDLPGHQGQKRRMTMANARFDPHVLIAQAGDTLELIERGPNQHIPNIQFFKNPARSIMRRPGQPHTIPLSEPEPAPISVLCSIHPWMKAYLVVMDHPFAAVSDESGAVTIEGLPVNTELVFRVFHEAGRVEQVEVNGTATTWNRSRFELRTAPGVNDLGEILVPAEALVGE